MVLVAIDLEQNDNGRVLALRQFVAPSLLVTNRDGPHLAIRSNDPSIPIELIGLVLT